MDSKVTKKISNLSFDPNQIIDTKKCVKIKGGTAFYYCCTRNQWYQN